MEAIGEKLRTVREEQGRSIEEVARETNIAKRFIIALEEEDFDAFPGEPYLIGFLRTYSETLGLSPDEIIALYKSFKIQEQPLPMDELINKPKRKKWWLIPVVIVCIVGIGVGLYFIIPGFRDGLAEREEKPEKTEHGPVESMGTVYEMKDEIIEQRFLEGDTVIVLMGAEEFPLHLVKIDKQLTIRTPDGELTISIGEESTIDLNNDTKNDIKIYVRDIDSSADPAAAVVRFDKFTQLSIAVTREGYAEDESSIFIDEGEGEAEMTAVGLEEASIPGIGSANFASREQRTTVILISEEKRPFTLDVIFRGYCMMRYLTNTNIREERYFHKGETFRLEEADSVWLWLSNAGACKGRIAGAELEFGRPGEVATKLLEWRQNNQSGAWELTLVPVY